MFNFICVHWLGLYILCGIIFFAVLMYADAHQAIHEDIDPLPLIAFVGALVWPVALLLLAIGATVYVVRTKILGID